MIRIEPMNNAIKLAIAALSLLICQTGSALTLDDWGTSASSGTSTCAGFSLPGCGVGTGPLDFGPDADNVNGLSADSTVVSARGSAEGHAALSLSSGISTPELKARGAGTSGGSGVAGIGQGLAAALEGYTYSGPGTTITLDIELTGTINNPNGRDFTFIDARVYVLNPADFDPDGFGTINLGGYLFEGVFPVDSTILTLDNSGSSVDSLALDLEDGDQFYIWATLQASAANGAVSDALNTLTMSFSSNDGLTAASAVPVPAAIWLLGSAVIGVFGLSRRGANV